ISEFLLLALADTRQLQLLHFWLLLGIYLAALLGNGLISTAVACDHRLHTPMYFFLLNLALLDLGCISTTLPKAMANALWHTRHISYAGCAAQVFFFSFLFSAEYSLLTVMSYDRYVAICKPLHYGTLLGSRACATMAAAAWGIGILNSLLHTANTFSLPLCQGNAVDQFFCEIPPILKLSCSKSYLREFGLIMAGGLVFFGCFVFIVVSYVQIFRAVLRMPFEKGRHKAFSTCIPHLAVVSLFVSTAMLAYLKPHSISSPSLDLVVSVLYSVVPPAVNPLIYSMRSQELKDALRKRFILGLVTFIVFMSEIESGMECTHNKSDDDTKLRSATDTTEGADVIQRDPKKLEKWVNVNLMRFSKPKCKVLNMGWGNPRYVHRLGKELTESISAEQDLGALMDKRLDIRKQCALAAPKTNSILCCNQGGWPAR
ncbi:olfactory receptor 14A16-like, partial [Gallus gallus]|uniref:olfactory receptor 14A16-like n=1 Tax=Gallus gallus TaxID=9031 RepID=UPI001F0040CB